MGCFVAEALSGPVIEAVRHEGDVFVGDVIEGHFLWKEDEKRGSSCARRSNR